MARLQGGILAYRINDKTLKIPLGMSFNDSTHYGILPLRVQVMFKYSLRAIALQRLRPWPFTFWLIE